MKKDKKIIPLLDKSHFVRYNKEAEVEYIFVFPYGSDFEKILRCFGSRSALNKPVHT